jgi:hypothetical protein
MMDKHMGAPPVQQLIKDSQAEGLIKETTIYWHNHEPEIGYSSRL